MYANACSAIVPTLRLISLTLTKKLYQPFFQPHWCKNPHSTSPPLVSSCINVSRASQFLDNIPKTFISGKNLRVWVLAGWQGAWVRAACLTGCSPGLAPPSAPAAAGSLTQVVKSRLTHRHPHKTNAFLKGLAIVFSNYTIYVKHALP